MAIPNKDQGQPISIDDIEDEFLNEDDGEGQSTPISFGSFRGELGTFFGIPLSFSQFSGKSIDPDLNPITATGGQITSDFGGLRQYTLGQTATLTAYKVAQSYGETAKGLTVSWRQTVGKLQANLNIDNETGESITFTAPFALNDTQVAVRATVVDWQGDESYEDYSFIIRKYQVPDPPALEDPTVDGAPQSIHGVLSQYDLESDNSTEYWKSASAEFELTEDSAYHPLGIDYNITWEIVAQSGGTFNAETRSRSDGRKYLFVEKLEKPDDNNQSYVDVRGTASDLYNPQTGSVIRITFERGKRRLKLTPYSQSYVARANISQLPSDIKGDLATIKTATASLPDDYTVILFLQVRARYLHSSESTVGVLDLPDGQPLPLKGETVSSNKINWGTRWGNSDGWNPLYRADGKTKTFEFNGNIGTTTRNLSVRVNVTSYLGAFYRNIGYTNYNFFSNTNVFYKNQSVKTITSALVDLVDDTGSSMVFGAFKIMKASEVAQLPDSLDIFQNYAVGSENVNISAAHCGYTNIKSHHIFSSVGGNFSEDDKVYTSVNTDDTYGSTSVPLPISSGYSKVNGVNEMNPKSKLYSDSTKPLYPFPYYLSNENATIDGLRNAYEGIPDSYKTGVYPFPDAKLVLGSASLNTTYTANQTKIMQYPSKPALYGLIGGSAQLPSSPYDNKGFYKEDGYAHNPDSSYSWSPFAHNISFGIKDYQRDTRWGDSIRKSDFKWDVGSNYGEQIEQSNIPVKGGTSTVYEQDDGVLTKTSKGNYWGDQDNTKLTETTSGTGTASTVKYTYYTYGYKYEAFTGDFQDYTSTEYFDIPDTELINLIGAANLLLYVDDEYYRGETDTIDNQVYVEDTTPGSDPTDNLFNVYYNW